MATASRFDVARALLRSPDYFQRFRTEQAREVPAACLPARTPLLVFERGGESRGLLIHQMAYHHVAQGDLEGKPYLVSFWAVCNTGVGLTPRVDDRVHHFSAGGLYNGLALLIDDESRTYWDHITGEALHGPLRGRRLETWGIRMTHAAGAGRDIPDLIVLESRPRLMQRLVGWAMNLGLFRGRFPAGFRGTMTAVDPRLPEMENGLGVVDGEARRFYPLSRIGSGIDDRLGGHPLRVEIDPVDGVPFATRPDGVRPLQLFSRWYGFSVTFPDCEIHGEDDAVDRSAG